MLTRRDCVKTGLKLCPVYQTSNQSTCLYNFNLIVICVWGWGWGGVLIWMRKISILSWQTQRKVDRNFKFISQIRKCNSNSYNHSPQAETSRRQLLKIPFSLNIYPQCQEAFDKKKKNQTTPPTHKLL